MARSRSPWIFLNRSGIVPETLRPAPRLNVDQLLVHTVPLRSPPQPVPEVLRQYEGDPPPDRGQTRAWPRTEAE
jgi:hypothetical protein